MLIRVLSVTLFFFSTAAAVEPGLPSKTSVMVAIARAIGAKGEPIILSIDGDNASTFVASAGLDIISDQNYFEIAKRYSMKPDGTRPFPGAPTDADASESFGKAIRICYARVPGRQGGN